VEVDVDFGNYGILDVDVSVGGGIHPHIQHPKKSGCRPLIATQFLIWVISLWAVKPDWQPVYNPTRVCLRKANCYLAKLFLREQRSLILRII